MLRDRRARWPTCALIIYLVVAEGVRQRAGPQGGDAAALVGGIATLLLFLAALAKDG